MNCLIFPFISIFNPRKAYVCMLLIDNPAACNQVENMGVCVCIIIKQQARLYNNCTSPRLSLENPTDYRQHSGYVQVFQDYSPLP